MQIRSRRWLRAVGLAVLAGIGIVVVGSWAIVRAYGPAFTGERVEALLTEALGQPVRVGGVALQPWRGRLSLTGIDAPRATAPGGPAFRAAAVHVTVDIASVWRRAITLSVLATDLRVELAIDGAEPAGRPKIFPIPDSVEIGPLHIGIGSVRVRNGDVVLRRPEDGLAIALSGADLTARPASGALDVRGQIDTLRVDALGRREQIERVIVDGRVSGDVVHIGRLSARWHGETIQIDGDIRNPWEDSRTLALSLKGTVALGPVAASAGLDQRVEGMAQVAAEITGSPASPHVASRVRIAELRVAGTSAQDVAIDATWADRTLRLDPLRARLGDGRLSGRLEAGPDAGIALDLSEVVLPGSLARLGSGTAVARGRMRDGGLDVTRGEASWRGLSASLDGRIATAPGLALRATLDADLRAIGQVMGGGPLSGRGRLSVELSDREQRRALGGRVEVRDLVAAGQRVEPVDLSFRMTPAPGADGRWDGTVQTPRVRWNEVAIDDVRAALSVDGRRVELTRLQARAAAVPIDGAGTWEWSGSGRARASLGPVALADVAGVPATLRLGGSARATVDAAVARGVASTSAAVDLDQVSASGVALGTGRAELRTRGSALDGHVAFPARRLRVDIAGALETAGALTARLELDDLALPPLLRDLGVPAGDRVDGRVSARGDLSIPLSRPAEGRGVVRLTPNGLRLGGEAWSSAEPIVLRWEGPRVLVERFRLDSAAGRLTATGPLLGPDPQGLKIELDAALPGGLASLGRGTARAEVRVRGEGVDLKQLDARWPGFTATASGQTATDGAMTMTARVDADLGRVGPAVGMSGVAGRVTLTADARGRPDALSAVGRLHAPAVDVRGVGIRDVDVPFRLSRTALQIERARARIGAGQVSADGNATWPASFDAEALRRETRLRADVRAPSLALQDLAPLLPAAVAGRGEMAFSARAEGTPSAWRGSGTLTAPLVELKAGAVRQLRVNVAVDQTRIQVTELRADALGIPARGTASWNWAGGGTVSASLGPASLASVAMVPATLDARGTGRATIEATVRSASDLDGSARAALEGVAIGGHALGDGRLDLTARGGVVRAELAFPEARLQAAASGRVDASGALVADATVPSIDLAPWAKGLLPPSLGAGGTLSARATARVPLAEPRRGEGRLSIDPLRLVVAGQTWESRGPVELRWAQGGFALADVRITSNDGLVTASGTVAPDGRLDADASARLPLAQFAGLVPGIRELGGTLDLSLRAAGMLDAPTFAGEGAIRQGSVVLRDRPESLRDVEARFTMAKQGVHLREVTASMGGGRVQANGDVALRGWRLGGYRVRLNARQVALALVDGLSSVWDADLELSGITGQAQLEGRAKLVRGAYTRDLSVVSLALAPGREAADTGPPLRLRVRVDLDDNLVVKNRTADLRAGGVLSVEGMASHPVIFGYVRSRDGRVVFRGRDWTVTNAAIRFADPRRVDPFLDVVAASRIGEYDVTMHITGPASDLAVRLSSTPRLSQNDLLSLVAFGATGADLKESPATVLLGEAGKLLARNLFGIEPKVTGLRVSTGSSVASTTEVRSGFPGEERLTTGPTRSTPDGRSERVRVEYQLFAPLFLAGEYDREDGYGADVVLRFRFR